MKKITSEYFHQWMETYGQASAENNPQASASRFAENSAYFEIHAFKENIGIARWQSRFTVVESGKRLALDCVFLVEFDDDGKCSEFRGWWHIQEARELP